MGGFFSKIFSSFTVKKARVLILGLDNAGKTTILYKLQIGEVVQTIPTVGFNMESLTYEGMKLQVWDLGGQKTLRPYWRCYYGNDVDAIIFVIDSGDKKRIELARKEMFALLEEPELKNAILVLFANKQDLKDAMKIEEMYKQLNLKNIKNRTYQLFSTSAKTGSGLKTGMSWMVE